MIETFTALLLAHILADFVLQTRWIVMEKRRFPVLLLHGALVLVTMQAAFGRVDAAPLLALALAHMAIDAAKTRLSPASLAAFLADQALHLATLVALALMYPGLWAGGLWAALGLGWASGLMAAIAGLITATMAGGHAIGLLMQPWAGAKLPNGMTNAGRLIGILERALIFLMVMVGEPAGIGFLIAAKSILRFETTARDQAAGEYVIIGTLASYGWALVASYGTLWLVAALPPLPGLPALH